MLERFTTFTILFSFNMFLWGMKLFSNGMRETKERNITLRIGCSGK
jgi:hypothetical protein